MWLRVDLGQRGSLVELFFFFFFCPSNTPFFGGNAPSHSLWFLWGCRSQDSTHLATGIDPWPKMGRPDHLFPEIDSWVETRRHRNWPERNVSVQSSLAQSSSVLAGTCLFSDSRRDWDLLRILPMHPLLAEVTQGWQPWLNAKDS